MCDPMALHRWLTDAMYYCERFTGDYETVREGQQPYKSYIIMLNPVPKSKVRDVIMSTPQIPWVNSVARVVPLAEEPVTRCSRYETALLLHR